MKSARRSTCDGTRSTLPAGDAHPSLWCPQRFPRLHHTLPAWLTFTRPVPLGGQTGPARPKAPILSHAVRLSSGQTHPPALLASEILSSGRTSQVALGSLPGVKDQGQTSLWVRLTLHHTRLQFGMGEGIGEGQGPRSAGGQEGLRTALLRLGCAHTLKVIDLHVAPGIWRLLLWLVAGHLQVFLTAVACWV